MLVLSGSDHISPVRHSMCVSFLNVRGFSSGNGLINRCQFVNLLASRTCRLAIRRVPLLHRGTGGVVTVTSLPHSNRTRRGVVRIVGALPHSSLFRTDIRRLCPVISNVDRLRSGGDLHLFDHVSRCRHFISYLICVPHSGFGARLHVGIRGILGSTCNNASSNFAARFGRSTRTHIRIRMHAIPNRIGSIGATTLRRGLSTLVRS